MQKRVNVMGSGESTKDLLHLNDCVDAIYMAAAKPPEIWRSVLIGTGQPISVKSVAYLVAKRVSEASPSEPPVQVVHVTAAPNDLSGAVDTSPAFQQLGWTPLWSLEDVIHEAIENIHANREDNA